MKLIGFSLPKNLYPNLQIFVLGFLIFSFFPLHSVSACSPTATPAGFKGYSVADRTNAAQIVVEGTIQSVQHYQVVEGDVRFSGDEATIEVQRYLKGSGAKSI